MISIFSTIKVLFFPEICICCGRKLVGSEKHICTMCRIDAPLTAEWHAKENDTYEKICDRTLIENACSFLPYLRSNRYSQMVQSIKFKGERFAAENIGEWMGSEIFGQSDFYKDVDLILPVPLHRKRLRSRGYNQSEYLARGMNRHLGAVIETKAVERIVSRKPQVKTGSIEERWKNAEGLFRVVDPPKLQGKHILIVDDVITSGATVISLVNAVKESVPDVRISVVALCSTTKYVARGVYK